MLTGSAPLIAVVGPTGSGKTALALSLAEQLGAEIVSADSMQFYQGMEIGSAAPTPAERARAPHHFVAFLSPAESMNAGAYAEAARRLVMDAQEDNRPLVIVGGSGLYLSALIDGIFEGPPRQPELRERLQAEAAALGNNALMQRLQRVDPEYAATLTSENDLVRIVRALEVYQVSGTPFSELHRRHQALCPSLPVRQVALAYPRPELYARIEARVEQMLELGWLDEVRALLEAGHEQDIVRLKALGYRELISVLRGEQALEAATTAIKQHHRRYAKRQLTWFRADDRIAWLDASAPLEILARAALQHGSALTP